MSGATVNSGGGSVGEKSQSAFSAVVRKSFSSFSVDSILSGNGGDSRTSSGGGGARHPADEASDGEHHRSPRRSPLRGSGSTHTTEFLLQEADRDRDIRSKKNDRPPDRNSPPASPGGGGEGGCCDDDHEDDEEVDIHVDTDTEDEKERDGELRPQPIIRPTALGPLQDPRLAALGHTGPPHPHSLLPPHIQAGLWPTLPLLHHQLSLRALASKYEVPLEYTHKNQ
ncbi:hypothetical protein SK128_021463 [Halocaridina rubra]|uniref:Uncharacterized protein n=1 Tax=Halocaridina rubra TaxID=373956 RepID=A0AAN8ZS61_HALRR